MTSTSLTLLGKLQTTPDSLVWSRWIDFYTPLIHRWIEHCGIPRQDAEDLAQDVIAVVVAELPEFQHNHHVGAFRAWLKQITLHRIQEAVRSRARRFTVDPEQLAQRLQDPHSELSLWWDREHDRYLMARLLQFIQPEFHESTWRAFQRHVLEERPAAEVAAELHTSVNAVLISKSRVLQRLRERSRDLLHGTENMLGI